MEVFDPDERKHLVCQQLDNLIPGPYPPRRTEFPKIFAEQIEHRGAVCAPKA